MAVFRSASGVICIVDNGRALPRMAAVYASTIFLVSRDDNFADGKLGGAHTISCMTCHHNHNHGYSSYHHQLPLFQATRHRLNSKMAYNTLHSLT